MTREATALALLLFLTASAASAQAADADADADDGDGAGDEETLPMEQVIVTSGPFAGRSGDELTRPVTVIHGEELARRNRSTIGELLAQEPGVANSGFGPGVGQPVIRGLSGPRVMVLQNGIGSMDASTLSADHAVGLDAGGAEQVEIIKGPATLIYGSGAIGGIVNVVDGRLPEEVDAGFAAQGDFSFADNAGERQGNLDLGYGIGEFQFHAAYGFREAGDFEIPGFAEVDAEHHEDEEIEGRLENSDVDTQSGSASAAWITPTHVLALSVTRFETFYGIPGHADEHEEVEEGQAHEAGGEEGVHIDMAQTRYDLLGKWYAPLPKVARIELRAGYNRYEHSEIEGGGEIGTRFDNRQSESRAALVHEPFGRWRGEIGLHHSYRDFSSSGEDALAPATVTEQLGAFLVEELAFGAYRFELGARIEQVDLDTEAFHPNSGALLKDRGYHPLSLSAGTVFPLGHDYHLRLNLARSQRAPSAEELYSYGPHVATRAFERGSTALDVETANNVELSLERHHGRLRMTAGAYYTRFQDYIYQRPVDAGLDADGSGAATTDGRADRVDGEGHFEADAELVLYDYAQADARVYGAEAQLEYALLTRGPLLLDGRVFFDTVRAELGGGENLPRITPGRVGLGLNAELEAWSAALNLTRVTEQDRTAPLETGTGAYSMLSADLGYSLRLGEARRATVYLQGRNLLDEQAREHTSFLKDLAPLPGRSLIAGLRFEF